MNEFSAKRLGEILAFVDVLLETCTKGKETLTAILSEEHISEIIRISRSHKDSIHTIADRAQVLHSVMNKLESKGDRLRKMRDGHMDNKWDNATGVLEWLGYLEGMTIIHASTLAGVAEEIGHAELKSFADSYDAYHIEMFSNINDILHNLGRSKAKG